AKVIEYEMNRTFGKNINSGSVITEQHNTYYPIENRTKFTIQYNVKVSGIMKVFAPMIVSSMRKALQMALNNLKGILETQA
ncbi:MAG TPA: hypothetical protein VMB24_01455, partial [Dehalococcoidales bacterium]|nr:hypothetical protein [Dehalococcoidales bacterium]